MGHYRWSIEDAHARVNEMRLKKQAEEERNMFREELSELEIAYKTNLSELNRKIEGTLYPLLHYMEEFVNLHNENRIVSDKLDLLIGKLEVLDGEEDE